MTTEVKRGNPTWRKVDAAYIYTFWEQVQSLRHLKPKEIIERVKSNHPKFTGHTVDDYVYTLLGTPRKVIESLKDGKVSWGTVCELCRWRTSDEIKLFVLEETINLKLKTSKIIELKVYLKEGASMAEAIKKVTGEIPKFQAKTEIKAIHKEFDTLLEEMIQLSVQFKMKTELAMAFLPSTTLENGKIHYRIFQKVYMLRHLLKDQFEFVDSKVSMYLDEITKFCSAERAMRVASPVERTVDAEFVINPNERRDNDDH